MDLNIFYHQFQETFMEEAEKIKVLPPSGSHRRYFRISGKEHSAIGTFSEDIRENRAFLSFTRHFHRLGLRVPEIYAQHEEERYYLQQDLGDQNLKQLLDERRTGNEIPADVAAFYREALSELVKFQIKGYEGLDYSLCIPRDRFDRQSVLWDLNHFKYFFLKVSGLPFDEQGLENDFQYFADFLEKVDSEQFMFRDFQSRNIMIHNQKCYFIDYQGGRKGALQYDLASILFEAKTDLPFAFREELLDYYLDKLSELHPVNREDFLQAYYPFVLVRVLQAMGTYGLRGWVEKKPLFLQSVPYAIKNIQWLIENDHLLRETPVLNQVLRDVTRSEKFNIRIPKTGDKLRVRIFSFSYRKPLPDDMSGNGGGFVFDCRGVHNPGRYEEYRELTGKDQAVKDFFARNSEMDDFLQNVYSLVERTIDSYDERSFKHLQVSFGCTGGQHRSVFAADKLAERLQQNKKVVVELTHRELENRGQ